MVQLGESPYASMYNNPIGYSDPFGNDPPGDNPLDPQPQIQGGEEYSLGLAGLGGGWDAAKRLLDRQTPTSAHAPPRPRGRVIRPDRRVSSRNVYHGGGNATTTPYTAPVPIPAVAAHETSQLQQRTFTEREVYCVDVRLGSGTAESPASAPGDLPWYLTPHGNGGPAMLTLGLGNIHLPTVSGRWAIEPFDINRPFDQGGRFLLNAMNSAWNTVAIGWNSTVEGTAPSANDMLNSVSQTTWEDLGHAATDIRTYENLGGTFILWGIFKSTSSAAATETSGTLTGAQLLEETAAGGSSTIYRVVSNREAADVIVNGFRQAPISSGISSYEGKLFWTNMDDALWYKNWLGEGNQILKIEISNRFVFEIGSDVGRQFYYVSPERLNLFNSAIQSIK